MVSAAEIDTNIKNLNGGGQFSGLISLMMKFFLSVLLTLSFSAHAEKNCSFVHHYHVQFEGIGVSKVLRKKILKQLDPNSLIIQKKNEELNIQVCATLSPFKSLNDVLGPVKPMQAQHQVKVILSEGKGGFWNLKIEHFEPKNDKETVVKDPAFSFVSTKMTKELKDSELAQWVYSKILSSLQK